MRLRDVFLCSALLALPMGCGSSDGSDDGHPHDTSGPHASTSSPGTDASTPPPPKGDASTPRDGAVSVLDAGPGADQDAGQPVGQDGGQEAAQEAGHDAAHESGPPDAGPPEVIITAGFSGTDNAMIGGTSPDVTNLPRGTFQTDGVNLSGDFDAFIDTGSGNPAPALHLYDVGSSSGSVALSIASAGGYVKPARFSVQLDIMTLAPSTVILVGFYGALPAAGADTVTGFTGLALHTDTGSMDLVEGGVTKTNVAFTGTYNAGIFNTLGFTIDTGTGAISGVMLASAAFTFSSTSFTNSVTSYIVVGTEAGGPSGSCSYIDNLIVKD